MTTTAPRTPTELSFSTDDPATITADVILIGVGKPPKGEKGVALAGGTAEIDAALGGRLAETLAALGATGATGETTRLATLGATSAATILAVGLGAKTDGVYPAESLRRAAGAAVRSLAGTAVVATTLPGANAGDGSRPTDADVAAVAEGVLLGAYRFSEFKSRPEEGKAPVPTVILLGMTPADTGRAAIVAESVALARDLVNTPPRELSPAAFAERARALGEAAGLITEVLDEQTLADGGYGGILGVGAGSTRPPRLVRLEHAPVGVDGPTVVLIGKGITFDSGGLSLKPPGSMETMKSDMAGAAATLGTLLAAAKLNVGVRVIGYLPMAENMPSGAAIRPSDILTMYGGKTVEVLNTDAEGRLVLADALVRSAQDGPALILDIATLTGAQVVALGNHVSGVMGTDKGRAAVVDAAGRSGESMWPMPLPPELRPSIDSEIADLQNIGDRSGGMLTAGLFLQEFVPDGAEWAHLDIAGPAYSAKAHGYTPKGGTGVGVRTMLAVVENVAAHGV